MYLFIFLGFVVKDYLNMGEYLLWFCFGIINRVDVIFLNLKLFNRINKLFLYIVGLII